MRRTVLAVTAAALIVPALRAGVTDRGASFVQGATATAFPPTSGQLINRLDQSSADPTKPPRAASRPSVP